MFQGKKLLLLNKQFVCFELPLADHNIITIKIINKILNKINKLIKFYGIEFLIFYPGIMAENYFLKNIYCNPNQLF